MLAEEVDAVIGGDTHRDSHALEMTAPTGATISTTAIGNDEVGYADAVAWIAENAPGPRVIVGLEGTRSYGVGLSRALQAAGFTVVEVERPRRADRRRGKSDPIDAHLAALHVLRMPADRKTLPRNDGDREALRILLGARRHMTTAKTQQINRLRALLLTGDDADRQLCRGAMSDAHLQVIARRRGRPDETREQQIRRAEARRLAVAIREATSALAANKKQLAELVASFAPGLLDKFRVRPGERAPGHRLVLPPRAVPKRRGVRGPGRGQPAAGQQRPDGAAPAEPRRRPATQPGTARHRKNPLARLPPNPRLHRCPARRGQERPRNPALPQALRCP